MPMELMIQLYENELGDLCALCEGLSGYIAIQNDFGVTYWVCDRCARGEIRCVLDKGGEAAQFQPV